jgi:hypothetical protein
VSEFSFTEGLEKTLAQDFDAFLVDLGCRNRKGIVSRHISLNQGYSIVELSAYLENSEKMAKNIPIDEFLIFCNN